MEYDPTKYDPNIGGIDLKAMCKGGTQPGSQMHHLLVYAIFLEDRCRKFEELKLLAKEMLNVPEAAGIQMALPFTYRLFVNVVDTLEKEGKE